MATLDSLKKALREKATASPRSGTQSSDTQYSAGFDIFLRGSGWMTYRDFIIPQLSHLLASLSNSQSTISVLGIGPGTKSVLRHLPGYLRQKIKRYAAFEPNSLYAASLEKWLCSTSSGIESPLPCLKSPPDIHQRPFVLRNDTKSGAGTGKCDGDEKFDLILFWHSLDDMDPKAEIIEQILGTLVQQPDSGMVVVFHHDKALYLDGLVSTRTVTFPTGAVSVTNDDDALDCFARFIAGLSIQDTEADKALRAEWRKACRSLGRRDEAQPNHLFFSWPNIMMAFTKNATTLPELTAQVPALKGDKRCMFLKSIGAQSIADILVAAIGTHPTPLCYLHFLQGGGAVRDGAVAAGVRVSQLGHCLCGDRSVAPRARWHGARTSCRGVGLQHRQRLVAIEQWRLQCRPWAGPQRRRAGREGIWAESGAPGLSQRQTGSSQCAGLCLSTSECANRAEAHHSRHGGESGAGKDY